MPELPAAFEAACRWVAPDQCAALQAEAVHARLLHVLLHKDAPHLSAILSSGFASAEQLAVVKPLGVFHAAALSGWAEAVPQLVAAGAPIRSAEAFLERNAPAHALSLLGPPADRHQRFVTHHGASALAIAAARGDPETIRALLAVDVGTRCVLARRLFSHSCFLAALQSWQVPTPLACTQTLRCLTTPPHPDVATPAGTTRLWSCWPPMSATSLPSAVRRLCGR